MSKERLEEIKVILNDYEVSYTDDYASAIDDATDDVNWLIEQAELVSKHETRINNLTFDLASSRVQNKRYREAIEKAIEMIRDSTGTITKPKEISLYDAWKIKDTLLEALEDEK